MAHAVPKRCHGLATQDAARSIGHGAADDEGQALTTGFKIFFDGKQRGFGIECVKDGFHQQHVHAAFHQGLCLFVIGFAQSFKIHIARAGVVHIGADAGRLGGGAQGAHGITRFVGGRKLVTRCTCQCGRSMVHLNGQVGHVVVGLRNGGGAKGVGFNQVGASRQIAFVNIANHIGARQAEQFVVALDVFGKVFESLTAVIGLAQFKALNHGAHGAIENGNAFFQNGWQGFGAGVVQVFHGAIVENQTDS